MDLSGVTSISSYLRSVLHWLLQLLILLVMLLLLSLLCYHLSLRVSSPFSWEGVLGVCVVIFP